jgi:hypothetical protein
MVQMGQLSPTVATMAAMMRDRIVQSEMKPPEQATVVEEVFKPAAPQAAGLAAVPTNPQMFQGMAGGGIVAMANGGTPPTFTDALYGADPIYGTTPEAMAADQVRVEEAQRKKRLEEKMLQYNFLKGSAPQVAAEMLNADPELKAALTPKPVAPAPAAAPAPAVKPPAGLPAAAAAAKPTAPAAGIAGLDAYKKAEETRIADMEKNLGKPSTIAEEAARQQEINKAMGVDPDFFKNQAKELVQQREELKGDRKEAANMRLLEAGLNILGGTSPYAFENIGKGASKALAGFADDIKDIKKQQRELDIARRQVLAAEQAAARSDSASVSARLDRSRDKFEAKEAALRDAKVEAQKTLVDMGLKTRQVAATELSAKAQMTSALRPPRERSTGITEGQLATLRMKAAAEVDPARVRDSLAKQQGLAKTPKEGQDPAFDRQVQQEYRTQIEDKVRFYTNQSDAAAAVPNTFPGYSLVQRAAQ